jgi:hypothetical protein
VGLAVGAGVGDAVTVRHSPSVLPAGATQVMPSQQVNRALPVVLHAPLSWTQPKVGAGVGAKVVGATADKGSAHNKGQHKRAFQQQNQRFPKNTQQVTNHRDTKQAP